MKAVIYALDGNDYGATQKIDVAATTIKVTLDEDEGGEEDVTD